MGKQYYLKTWRTYQPSAPPQVDLDKKAYKDEFVRLRTMTESTSMFSILCILPMKDELIQYNWPYVLGCLGY